MLPLLSPQVNLSDDLVLMTHSKHMKVPTNNQFLAGKAKYFWGGCCNPGDYLSSLGLDPNYIGAEFVICNKCLKQTGNKLMRWHTKIGLQRKAPSLASWSPDKQHNNKKKLKFELLFFFLECFLSRKVKSKQIIFWAAVYLTQTTRILLSMSQKAGKHNGRSSQTWIQPRPKLSSSALSVFPLSRSSLSVSFCAHEVKYIFLRSQLQKHPLSWRGRIHDSLLRREMMMSQSKNK